jgi:hypothetical protein
MVMAFDIDKFQQESARLAYDDLDFEEFSARPLSPDGLRCLRYMSDVETHTICYLRDLLVTPSHKDPEVTTFLTMWVHEEHWHGEALAGVLDVHGVPTGHEHIRKVRLAQGWADRVAPITQALAANVLGEDYVAVHMTWGAINEWSAHAAYARLIKRENHPILTTLLTRIMKQESRHAAFYATQARTRLERSRKAQRLTRWALRAFWGPVGSGEMPRGDTEHVLGFLLGGETGAKIIAKIDEKVHSLPGLDRLDLVRRAAAKYGVRGGLDPAPAAAMP